MCVCTQTPHPALSGHPVKEQPLPPPSTVNSPPMARCSSERGTEVLFVLLFTLALNKYSAKASLQCQLVFLSTALLRQS